MPAYSAGEWESLFVAEAGASAALAGLLFVALSINLERILKGTGLPGRAGEAIVLLLTVLVVTTFGLVPGQSPRVLGAEVLGFGLLPWLILIGIHVDGARPRRAIAGVLGSPHRVGSGRCAAAVNRWGVATAPYRRRLYWLVSGIVLCLVVAVLDAWVLLVEILR